MWFSSIKSAIHGGKSHDCPILSSLTVIFSRLL
jgi:hypothetical protein